MRLFSSGQAAAPRRSRLGKVKYRIARYRRGVQLAVLAFLILAPLLDWLRIDLTTSSLHLFGMQLWVRQIYVLGLLTATVIYLIIAATFLFGRIFCGWVCPQNLFNELGRRWDARFGRPGTVALSALISTFGGFILTAYVIPWRETLARTMSGPFPWITWSVILTIGAFFTLAMAYWRTDICKVACPYGHFQAILTTENTMHLRLFQTSTDICATCGLCAETCHMDVDPRTLEQKQCVTCGDCLDACQLVSDARKVDRVLQFVAGPDLEPISSTRLRRFNWRPIAQGLIIPVALGGLLVLASVLTLVNRPQVAMELFRDPRLVASGPVYQLVVRNLSGEPETYDLVQDGLPESWVAIDQRTLALAPGEEVRLRLVIIPPPSGAPEKPVPYVLQAIGRETGARAEVSHTWTPSQRVGPN